MKVRRAIRKLHLILPLTILGLTCFPVPASAIDLPSPGNLYSWGNNAYGQLGNATKQDANLPQMVAGLSDIVAVSASNEHTLALKSDGTVWAWGGNSSGQLGTNLVDESNVPLKVAGLEGVVAVAAGSG